MALIWLLWIHVTHFQCDFWGRTIDWESMLLLFILIGNRAHKTNHCGTSQRSNDARLYPIFFLSCCSCPFCLRYIPFFYQARPTVGWLSCLYCDYQARHIHIRGAGRQSWWYWHHNRLQICVYGDWSSSQKDCSKYHLAIFHCRHQNLRDCWWHVPHINCWTFSASRSSQVFLLCFCGFSCLCTSDRKKK